MCMVDWRTPGLDALATIQALRDGYRDYGRTPPPMILVTAFSNGDEIGSAGEAVQGILTKPFTFRHFQTELAQCLEPDPTCTSNSAGRRQQDKSDWTSFRGIDVLVVDDVEINRELVGELLANEGITTRFACNGREAVDEIQRRRPGIVLMDIQMPVMDGIVATQTLRNMHGFRDLPIVAVTANAMAEEAERCLAAGMNAHVAKPIQMDDLYRAFAVSLPGRVRKADLERVETSIDDDQAHYPDLPGIEVAVGLGYVKRMNLYLRLLEKFYHTRGSTFATDFTQALRDNDLETQIRLAHTLKGMARTLGAQDLGEAAAQLEAAARQGQGAEIAASFDLLCHNLQIVNSGIAALVTNTPLDGRSS